MITDQDTNMKISSFTQVLSFDNHIIFAIFLLLICGTTMMNATVQAWFSFVQQIPDVVNLNEHFVDEGKQTLRRLMGGWVPLSNLKVDLVTFCAVKNFKRNLLKSLIALGRVKSKDIEIQGKITEMTTTLACLNAGFERVCGGEKLKEHNGMVTSREAFMHYEDAFYYNQYPTAHYLSIAEKIIGPMLLQWLNAFGDCEIVQKAEKTTGYIASYFQDSDEKDTNPDVIRVAGKMCKFEYVLTMRQGLEQHVKVLCGALELDLEKECHTFHALFEHMDTLATEIRHANEKIENKRQSVTVEAATAAAKGKMHEPLLGSSSAADPGKSLTDVINKEMAEIKLIFTSKKMAILVGVKSELAEGANGQRSLSAAVVDALN